MIRMAPFDVHTPLTVQDACAILLESKGNAKILAGGTDVIVGVKQGTIRPQRMIWLGKIPGLKQISFSPDRGLTVGAMCTLADIGKNHDVQQYFPSLAGAIRSIGSFQIRNSATIGGNLCLDTRCFYFDQSEFWRTSLGYCLKHGDTLCHAAPGSSACTAVFCSDLAPLLIALDATIVAAGPDGLRNIPLPELYRNDGMNHLTLEHTEFLHSVSIPWNNAVKAIHQKVRGRGAIDFPLVNAGIAVRHLSDHVFDRARIIIGSNASYPVDVSASARKLLGVVITEELIETVSQDVAGAIHPLPNTDGSVSYRKRMVGVLVRRGLKALSTGPG